MSRTVYLDARRLKERREAHTYLSKMLSLPSYYGNNMDALWDCLSCCYDESTTIELKNLDVLRKRLEQTTKTMLEVFQDLHNEDGVVIQIAEEETTCAEKCFTADSDNLSGYMV